MMIKVIIFDLWKTLGDKPSVADAFRKKLSITDYPNYLHDYEVADHLGIYKDYAQMAKSYCRYFNKKCDSVMVKELVKIKKDSFADAKMYAGIDIVLKSLSKDHVIVNISNTNNIDIKVLDRWKIRKYFDHVFASFTTKILKPDKKVFLYTLKKLKVKPQECLFIDDKKSNLAIAKRLGFNTLHFISVKELRKDLMHFFKERQ